MPQRRATRRYETLAELLAELPSTFQVGAALLPGAPGDEPLADEFKLDLFWPIVGRVGPLTAQVIQRLPDGSTAARLPEFEREGGAALRTVLEALRVVEAHLLASGQLVRRVEAEGALDRVAALEAERDALAAERDALAAERDALAAERDALRAGGAVADGEGSGRGAGAGAERSLGRGFPLPDVRGREPLISGALGDASLRDALGRLALERQTGLLTLELPGGLVRSGFWSKGGPVGFRADPLVEPEVLGALLFKAGSVTKEQLEESLVRMKASGVRQGEAFIEMGVLTFPQLVLVLARQVEFVLQKVLAEREGRWAFHALPELPEAFLPPPARVPQIIYRALLTESRTMRADALADLVRPWLDHYVHLDGPRAAVLPEIKLSAEEAKLADVLRAGDRRLREVFAVSPLSRQVTAGIIWSLEVLGFLRYEGQEDEERYRARTGEFIERKKRQLARANHFEFMEAHWISLPNEIDEAYRRLVTEYAPTAFRGLSEAQLADLARIRERLDTAYETLRDDTRRREYRKSLIELPMLQQSAELLARKGEMAVMRRDRREATSCYAKAVELQPGVAEYKDGLARANAL